MSRHVTSRHVTSRHVTSRHVTSRHVTSRHITSRHVTSRRIMQCGAGDAAAAASPSRGRDWESGSPANEYVNPLSRSVSSASPSRAVAAPAVAAAGSGSRAALMLTPKSTSPQAAAQSVARAVATPATTASTTVTDGADDAGSGRQRVESIGSDECSICFNVLYKEPCASCEASTKEPCPVSKGKCGTSA
jgi:hypothetical protein